MYLERLVAAAFGTTFTPYSCYQTLGKAGIPDNGTARLVSLDYTLAVVAYFQKKGAQNHSHPFIAVVLPPKETRLSHSDLCRTIDVFGYDFLLMQ
jgi:hypothetical protein